MINIFDLDYTLMDTIKFKNDLASVFGMSVDKWDKSYATNFKNKGINYSIDSHVKILKEDGTIKSKDEVKNKFAELLKTIDNYLFPSVKEILEIIKERGEVLVLATFGDIGWQKLKVDSLKINNLFDEIVLADKEKSENEHLKELKDGYKDQQVNLFNDNAKELEEMKRLFGEKARGYLIEGPYSNNIEHDMKVHESLESSFSFKEK